MIVMEASDIVIHKGEKEEKYQLYVEDYVMSYLKNYRNTDKRKIYFFGERLPDEKKYYIYGAGRQKQISYFERYKLLDDIICHYVMDMPVFSVIENTGTYELSGYNIFYQSNDAMQSYMIDQRKNAESEEKEDKIRAYIKGKSQSEAEVKPENQIQNKDEHYKKKTPVLARVGEKKQKKHGSGLMTAQILAIFIIIAVIAINSTNSYDKLWNLGQSAVEVFFVLENQDAATDTDKPDDTDRADSELIGETDKTSNETVLRLTDLDDKFAKENNAARLEDENSEDNSDEENGDKSETENQNNGDIKTEEEADGTKEPQPSEAASSSEQAFSRNITEYYRIEKGDTLYTISVKIYGDSSKVDEICELNQITNPDHIEYGQKILLP